MMPTLEQEFQMLNLLLLIKNMEQALRAASPEKTYRWS